MSYIAIEIDPTDEQKTQFKALVIQQITETLSNEETVKETVDDLIKSALRAEINNALQSTDMRNIIKQFVETQMKTYFSNRL